MMRKQDTWRQKKAARLIPKTRHRALAGAGGGVQGQHPFHQCTCHGEENAGLWGLHSRELACEWVKISQQGELAGLASGHCTCAVMAIGHKDAPGKGRSVPATFAGLPSYVPTSLGDSVLVDRWTDSHRNCLYGGQSTETFPCAPSRD